MAIEDGKSASDGKLWSLCKIPFWQSNCHASTSSSSSPSSQSNQTYLVSETSNPHTNSVSLVARSFLPTRRRLHLDPSNELYLPYEPGRQVKSAITIKNISKSHLAFKFQTTSPKSCFMRPPGGILSPGESIIATVFKFVEHPENGEKPMDIKCKVKFKIMSLKVNAELEYVPELFDELKDHVIVEKVLRAVFLDVDRPSPELEKLKHMLAEAGTVLETRKRPQESGPKVIGEVMKIDEWKERRERYLARQLAEWGVNST